MIKNQRGISLIITFLIMTVMLATVLGLSTILFNKVKILSNIGNAASSLYASESGIEKTLYFDRKEGVGNRRGLCRLCNNCTDCDNCTTTPLSSGGCNVNSCNNCKVTYDFTFNDRIYTVDARSVSGTFFSCNVKGAYKDTTRSITITSRSLSDAPIEE